MPVQVLLYDTQPMKLESACLGSIGGGVIVGSEGAASDPIDHAIAESKARGSIVAIFYIPDDVEQQYGMAKQVEGALNSHLGCFMSCGL